MVTKLQNYNQYLESFSRRLSHELKTPVAVVRSSLENLAQESPRTNGSNMSVQLPPPNACDVSCTA